MQFIEYWWMRSTKKQNPMVVYRVWKIIIDYNRIIRKRKFLNWKTTQSQLDKRLNSVKQIVECLFEQKVNKNKTIIEMIIYMQHSKRVFLNCVNLLQIEAWNVVYRHSWNQNCDDFSTHCIFHFKNPFRIKYANE